MGKEELINEIKSKTEREIEQKKEEALKKSKEVFSRAKKETLDETEEIRAGGMNEGKQEMDRVISSARLNFKRKVMNKKEEIIQEILEEAIKRIENEDSSEYEDDIKDLVIFSSLELKGGELVIHGDSKSLKVLEEDIKELEERIEEETGEKTSIELGEEIDETGVIVEKGEVRVNNTIRARKERFLDDLRIKISSKLFEEPKGEEELEISGVEEEIEYNGEKLSEEELMKEAEDEAEELVREEFGITGWDDGST